MNKNRKQRKTRKMKGGGKGTPFNMSNMLSALKKTTKVKTNHLLTKKRTPKFHRNHTIVVERKNTKSTPPQPLLSEEKVNRMFAGIKNLKELYNKEDNETLRDYYGTIEQELRDELSIITGDKMKSEVPFEFLLSLEAIKYTDETSFALYKEFNRIMSKFKKEKKVILKELKEIMENKPKKEQNEKVKEADDELSALFAGMGI